MLKYIPMSGGKDGYSLFVTYAADTEKTLSFKGYVVRTPNEEDFGPNMRLSEAVDIMNGLINAGKNAPKGAHKNLARSQ